MEGLYRLQFSRQSVIEKGSVNFKKAPKERLTCFYIQARLESVEKTWSDFLATHDQIIQQFSSKNQGDAYFTDDIYYAVEDSYVIYKTELKEQLEKIDSKRSKDSYVQQAIPSRHESVKLPKITIPMFSGNYAEWPTFKDLFSSLIHKNQNLDNVQRMYYLKGSLLGEAEQMVRYIPVTETSYEECWSVLKKRYDNKRFLSNCLLRRLMSQGNVSESAIDIKGLLDTTIECLNGLKNLGIDISSWDILIIFMMSAKLDLESRKLWEMQISSKDELPKLCQFKDFLETRFRALEFLDLKSAENKQSVNTYNPKVHHVVSPDVNRNIKCEFCNGNHKIANCKHFARESQNTRQNFIRTSGLCFNCFGHNHPVRFCYQVSLCRICNRKHHSLLHPKVVSRLIVGTENATANDVKSAVSSVQESLTVSHDQSTANVVSHVSKAKESGMVQVLLATALVKAQTRQGSTQLLRVLLDQGSQASFITQSAVQLLGLERTPTRFVSSGIGGERGVLASDHMVNLIIHSHLDTRFSLQLNAYVLSNITSLLPSVQVIPNKWPAFEDISLADPGFHTPNKIDVLLGADVYAQILREGLIQGPPGGPIAQNTALGWILSGKISSSDESICCHHAVLNYSDQADEIAILRQLGEIESVIPGPQKKIISEEERRCEEFCSQTIYRQEKGHNAVKFACRDDDLVCQYGKSTTLTHQRKCREHLELKSKLNPKVLS